MSFSPKLSSAFAIVVLIVGGLSLPAEAARDPGAYCAAAKIRAAANRVRAEMFCHAKAVQARRAVDAECLQKAAEKYAGLFRKAEERGGCATSGDAPALGDQVGACVIDVVTSLPAVVTSCSDQQKNGLETDVDCGGPCPRCDVGQACATPSDCTTYYCNLGLCQVPPSTCENNVLDGMESDIDCGGGFCPPCGSFANCNVDGDCASGTCLDWTCSDGNCNDGIQNGPESDIDCGGDCAPCTAGRQCVYHADCLSGVCDAGVCADTCQDAVHDGTETGVDCGGPACPGCPVGGPCNHGGDCASGACASGVCQVYTCDNGVQDGSETDVDCGGLLCAPCNFGQRCTQNSDCGGDALICLAGICQVDPCFDGVRNGNETDVDCGGGSCSACEAGRGCSVGGDCVSNDCRDGVCQALPCFNGILDGSETDIDCGGLECPSCGSGRQCLRAEDCQSSLCEAGICAPPPGDCFDGIPNGAETDVDCGGGACAPCDMGWHCLLSTDCLPGLRCEMEMCFPGPP